MYHPRSYNWVDRIVDITKKQMAKKETDMCTASGLKLQFSDDFNKEYGPPDHLDMNRWTKWKGDVRAENGRGVLTTTPPGDIGLAGIITRHKHGHPGLAGSNGVEVTLEEFTDRGDHPEGSEKSDEMRLVQAWGLTLGSMQGFLSHEGKNDRAVQLHFDLIRPNGLFVYLVRGLVPEDFEKYPKDGYTPGGPTHLSDAERRDLHEQLVERGEVFISAPCLQLINRVYRSEQKIQEFLGRRRWGLYLSDDANTVYWTLDGRVMDRVDIAGYFGSNPESVQDGAYFTISGVGDGNWKIDDVAILASPLDAAAESSRTRSTAS